MKALAKKAPSTKPRRSSKLQIPNFKATFARDVIGAWSLIFLWSLELGIWSLRL